MENIETGMKMTGSTKKEDEDDKKHKDRDENGRKHREKDDYNDKNAKIGMWKMIISTKIEMWRMRRN